MKLLPSLVPASLAACLMVLGACGGGNVADVDAGPTPTPDAEIAPTPLLRNPVDLPDDDLALAALQLLGANVTDATGSCTSCHSVSRQTIRTWSTLTDTSTQDCLTDLDISTAASARATIDCFNNVFDDPWARKLGIWATAVRLPWFQTLFERGTTDDGSEYEAFKSAVGMPLGGFSAMSQSEFDIVAEWFVRGVPQLDQTLDETANSCTPSIGPEVATHVADKAINGWRTHNADAGLAMYGCAGAATTLECMSDQTNASTTVYGATWSPGTFTTRILATLQAQTDYWSRPSADGRFFGSGGGNNQGGSSIMDLTDDHNIRIVDGDYDPGFFPDNSGWMFRSGNGGALCPTSILLGSPTSINMGSNAACAGFNNITLYQHLAAAVGGDYFAISGTWSNDDYGDDPTHQQPPAAFAGNNVAYVTPMIFDGQFYQTQAPSTVPIGGEGDPAISPNADLFASRTGNGSQEAYVLHAINATANGDGSYDVDAPEIARYCTTGSKAAFSFDDRWMTYHHYVENTDKDAQDLGFTDKDDPGFAPYTTLGAANIYVLDVLTGEAIRVTMMKPGQYAQYPAFRSDSWLYFRVKDNNSGKEYITASDAALQLE